MLMSDPNGLCHRCAISLVLHWRRFLSVAS